MVEASLTPRGWLLRCTVCHATHPLEPTALEALLLPKGGGAMDRFSIAHKGCVEALGPGYGSPALYSMRGCG